MNPSGIALNWFSKLLKVYLNHSLTYIKKVLATTVKADADSLYRDTVKIIDKAVSKNLIHRNTGARRKSQITRHINSLT